MPAQSAPAATAQRSVAAPGATPPPAARTAGVPAASWAVAGVGSALIVAGGLVSAINSAAPFAHGSWLAAFLVLVGGVAQLVLGLAPLALSAARPSARLQWAQVGSWNAGTAAVAAGVLVDSPALVPAGSVVVLVALACFAVGGGPARPGARGWMLLYRALVGVLAVSVLIGIVLAEAVPGS